MLNILVIDDQEFDRKMIVNRVKEALPYPSMLTEASTATQALELINSGGQTFDCILLDMNLPDMHAIDLTSVLVSANPHTCIIIITVEADMDKALKCLKSGAEDFLIKGEYSNEGLYRSIRYSMERRKASMENRRLEQELSHERELTAFQKEFIHLVSHEFRTPISIISGALQLLVAKKPEINTGDTAPQIAKIDRALTRLLGLLDNVLRLSRLEDGKEIYTPSKFDMLETLVQVLDWCESKRIVYPKTKLAVPFYGDKSMVEYAIQNVVANALKYSEKDSKVTVEITRANDAIDITVVDTGHGMSKATIAKLGEKFFRDASTSHIEGTGLGIHLVKRFMEHHGGELNIVSELGKGTTATLHFPFFKSLIE